MIAVEPGAAPGGLLFVLYDRHDREVHRHAATGVSEPSAELLERIAELHASTVVDRGGMVRVFDGDSGQIVAAVGVTR